jgi:predicted nucleic acid-binding protein
VCPTVIPIDVDTHETALRLAERYGFAMFDVLMVATALQAGSSTLWSEDMQDGMLIDGKLRITNPFRAPG